MVGIQGVFWLTVRGYSTSRKEAPALAACVSPSVVSTFIVQELREMYCSPDFLLFVHSRIPGSLSMAISLIQIIPWTGLIWISSP